MSNPTAAMLVIGDEILSGRTREANAYHLAGRLVDVVIDLTEIRVVPDDHQVIVDALRSLRTAHEHVFTSGGIGPTHDDITADAVAAAFEVGIAVREDARQLVEAAIGSIVNGVSGVPGFSVGNVHVMAGVPSIFVIMLDALLPTLVAGDPVQSREVRFEVGEGRIATPLRELAAAFPQLSIGSYPFSGGGAYGTSIVVRGTDVALIDAAVERLEALRRAAEGAGA